MTSQAFFSTTQFLNSRNNLSPPHLTSCSCTSAPSPIKPTRKRVQKSSSIRASSSSDSSSIAVEDPSTATSSNGYATESLYTDEENEAMAKVGARVRVKVPLKVYHIPRVPEFDLNGLEGELKQFVGVWKGKRISANLPFKVQFVENIEGRDGTVKFFAHLKEDEFEYLD